MPTYFQNAERQTRLRATVEAWRGTPFRARTCVRGKDGGVDCVNLLVGVMRDCGIEHDFQPPEYSLDWGLHQSESKLLAYLRGVSILELVPCWERLEPGDILTFQIGQTENHAGIFLGGDAFLHSVRKSGVLIGRLEAGWGVRLGPVFRAKTLNFQPSTLNLPQ